VNRKWVEKWATQNPLSKARAKVGRSGDQQQSGIWNYIVRRWAAQTENPSHHHAESPAVLLLSQRQDMRNIYVYTYTYRAMYGIVTIELPDLRNKVDSLTWSHRVSKSSPAGMKINIVTFPSAAADLVCRISIFSTSYLSKHREPLMTKVQSLARGENKNGSLLANINFWLQSK
jgi:hypothetical protein